MTGTLNPCMPASKTDETELIIPGEPGREEIVECATRASGIHSARPSHHRRQERLRTFDETVFPTLAFAAVCAAALGYLIVRRGLAPVTRIAKIVSEITS